MADKNPWELEQEKLTDPWTLDSAKDSAKGIFDTLKEDVESAVGLVPGVDYDAASRNVSLPMANPFMNAGASIARRLPDLWTRFQLGRMDNPSETEKYLDKKFGAKNWAKAGDRYVLKPETAKKFGYNSTGDAPVAIDPFGPDWGDVAEGAGSVAGPLLGGVAAGTLTAGAGFVPGLLAAGAGGAAGEGVNELLKTLEGYSNKAPKELAADIGAAGLSNAAGEGVFRIATPFLSRLLGPHTKRLAAGLMGNRNELKSTIDPDVLKQVETSLEQGYSPAISTATDKNILGRIQTAAEYVFGNSREPINTQAMIDARNGIAGRVGAPARTGTELTSSAPQEFIEKSGQAVAKDAAQGLLAADATTRAAEANFQKQVYKGFVKSDANTGAAVKNALNANVKAFYGQAKEAYSLYDDMAEGATINLDPVKAIARDFLESGPVKTVKNISTLGGRNTISSEQIPIQSGNSESLRFLNDIASMDTNQLAKAAVSLRTSLSSSIDSKGLPEVPDHIRRQMVKAIDGAMDDAAESGSINPEAVAYLKQTRAWYKDNIQKFEAKEVQRLLVDPSSASNVPADRVIDFVSSMKSGEQVLRLRAALPEATWKKVQRGAWDSMLEDTTSTNGTVDAKALSKVVNDKKEWLAGVFGKEKADQITTYSNYLSSKGGGLKVEDLGKGDPYTMLRNAAGKQQKLDEEWAAMKNVSDAVTKHDPTEFIPSMLKGTGSGPVKINQLKSLLGENSGAWKQFQAAAMEKILQPMVLQSDNAVKAVINPSKFRDSIAGYNAASLQAIFGKETYQDIIKFADTAKFATSKKSMLSGSIVAAEMAMHPLSHLGALAKFKVINNLMSSPGFIKYMTTGLREGWTRDSLRTLTRMTAQMVTPDVSPESLE